MFLALMVDAPGSLAPPPKGPVVDVFTLIVGAPGSPTAPLMGLVVNVFCIDGGYSWISDSTAQGVHCRHF
jgi:hypothetical protein